MLLIFCCRGSYRNGCFASLHICIILGQNFCTQHAGLSPVKFLGQFFDDLASNLFENLRDVFHSNSKEDVFYDWPFLGCLRVSFGTVANFRLFLDVAIFWGEKLFNSSEDWIILYFYINFGEWRKVCFSNHSLVTIFTVNRLSSGKLFCNNNSTLLSPVYTSSLAANIVVYTPNQDTNREKYFYQFNYKGKMLTLAGNKHLSIHFFPHRAHLFQLPPENLRA